jgi:hypothetical protein
MAALDFPRSLPDFMRLFPTDAACASYLEKVRWPDGFTCPWCGVVGEPYRFAPNPLRLACRSCKKDAWLLRGTVMERSHTPADMVKTAGLELVAVAKRLQERLA